MPAGEVIWVRGIRRSMSHVMTRRIEAILPTAARFALGGRRMFGGGEVLLDRVDDSGGIWIEGDSA